MSLSLKDKKRLKYRVGYLARNFTKRCGGSLIGNKKRLSSLAYHLLRNGPPICLYCADPVNVDTFSIDHYVPISRGGYKGWINVVLCCLTCNRAKGDLTGDEFKDLLAFLRQQGEEAYKSVYRRLRMAGYQFGRRN